MPTPSRDVFIALSAVAVWASVSALVDRVIMRIEQNNLKMEARLVGELQQLKASILERNDRIKNQLELIEQRV